MEDKQIIELYWKRDETAIVRCQERYGSYCGVIARNILQSPQDAEECVNDVWLAAWDSIPPQRPANLAAYLAKLTRNRAIDRWRSLHREKRGGDSIPLALEELAEVLPAEEDPERCLLGKELGRAVNGFLAGLSAKERNVFLCRYWYFDSIGDIAQRFSFSEEKVKSMLFRTRKKLLKTLGEEGLL